MKRNYRYILTERGKFIIALLVAFIIVLSLLFIAIWALSPNAAPNNMSQGNGGANGSDSNPDNPYSSSQGSSGGNSGSGAADSTLEGPIAFDLEEGILTFLFTLDAQTAIDDESFSLLGDLMSSPRNIRGSKIAVEIPKLPDEDTATLTSIILNAFADQGVSAHSILFYIYQPELNVRTFTISVSFR